MFSARCLLGWIVFFLAHICRTDFVVKSARPTSQWQTIKLTKEKLRPGGLFPTGDKNTKHSSKNQPSYPDRSSHLFCLTAYCLAVMHISRWTAEAHMLLARVHVEDPGVDRVLLKREVSQCNNTLPEAPITPASHKNTMAGITSFVWAFKSKGHPIKPWNTALTWVEFP